MKSSRWPRRVAAFAPFAVALASGCDDSFVKGWLVDRTRVLGVRVEAAADPTRASIAPGEPARMTWLVGAPAGTGRLAWAFAACAPPAGVFPDPRCEGPVLASGAGASEGEVVGMDVVVPEAAGDAREILVLAAFCEAGTPALDPGRFEATCAGAPALLASARVRLAAAGPNRNPEIEPDGLRFDGAPMPASGARGGAPCAGSDAPFVAPGSRHALSFRLRSEDREAPSPGGAPETLLASTFATGGELDRQYSALEPEEASRDVSVAWTAPSDASPGGRLVELFFVLRDGRGGLAFTRRAACVLP